MHDRERWEAIEKRLEVRRLITELKRLVNLKLHGVYAVRVIPPYRYGPEQWEKDCAEVLKGGQCLVNALPEDDCRCIDWEAAQTYGIRINREKATTDPVAAAVYITEWGYCMRLYHWTVPPWWEKAGRCGGGSAARRILGLGR